MGGVGVGVGVRLDVAVVCNLVEVERAVSTVADGHSCTSPSCVEFAHPSRLSSERHGVSMRETGLTSSMLGAVSAMRI